MLAKSEKAEGDVFNIGSTEEITILDLAKKIIALSESSSQILYVPYDQAYGKGFEDMQRRKPNIDKISKMLNWHPKYTLNDTLRSIIKHEADKKIDAKQYK